MVNVLERMNFSDYQTSITPKQYKQLVKMMTKNGNIETFWYMGIWIHPYIFATGRIKRMRSRRESRYVRLDKRLGKKVFSFNSDFCSNLTRWNRH